MKTKNEQFDEIVKYKASSIPKDFTYGVWKKPCCELLLSENIAKKLDVRYL